MTQSSDSDLLRPDARELLLGDNELIVCDTYIFEPAAAEFVHRLDFVLTQAQGALLVAMAQAAAGELR
jgi:hypothetical protein